MSRLIKIGDAAKILGVSIQTLRRWEREGYLVPSSKSKGMTRYYLLEDLIGKKKEENTLTLAYARVSSDDQKQDLVRQVHALEAFCTSSGWKYEVISDLGSGMNYRKKGLKKLLHSILNGSIKRLVITHKDRLLRFGAELIFALCEARSVEVVMMNASEEVSFEEELVQDILEIITVFSARLYGSRSEKTKNPLRRLKR